MGKVYDGSEVEGLERWEDSEVARSKRSKVVRWQNKIGGSTVRWQEEKSKRVVRWECGKFIVLFKGRGRRVSTKFYLCIFDVNQQKEVPGEIEILSLGLM